MITLVLLRSCIPVLPFEVPVPSIHSCIYIYICACMREQVNHTSAMIATVSNMVHLKRCTHDSRTAVAGPHPHRTETSGFNFRTAYYALSLSTQGGHAAE